LIDVPYYDYRCRECGTVFELRREMGEASRPATCPAGHDGTVRLLSTFSAIGRAEARVARQRNAPCAGHCTCHRANTVLGS
jgi:putative FmdB family regulatory protein